MKTIQLLLPDNLHDQLQSKAKESGFDLSTYMLALLAEGAVSPAQFPSASSPPAPVVQSPAPPPAYQPAPIQVRPPPVFYGQKPGGSKGPQSNMAVTIRWDLIGKGSAEPIRASTAAATLAFTIKRLTEVLGDDVLARLSRFKVSRGPLVSTNPGQSFVNGQSGETYGNHLIPGTSHYVLTHSSTQEKIDTLHELPRLLSQPGGLLEARKVPKL